MQLYQVYLLSHPSCDHMDPSADIVKSFFTLSISPFEAISKVIQKVKNSLHYGTGCFLRDGLPPGVTPEQALAVLKAVGLAVID